MLPLCGDPQEGLTMTAIRQLTEGRDADRHPATDPSVSRHVRRGRIVGLHVAVSRRKRPKASGAMSRALSGVARRCFSSPSLTDRSKDGPARPQASAKPAPSCRYQEAHGASAGARAGLVAASHGCRRSGGAQSRADPFSCWIRRPASRRRKSTGISAGRKRASFRASRFFPDGRPCDTTVYYKALADVI